MIIPGTADTIVVCGTANENDIIAFKKPVYILEPMLFHIGVMQYDGIQPPIPQIQ